MPKQTEEGGASPVVGVIIITAITIILSAVVGSLVFGLAEQNEEVRAGVSVESGGEEIRITMVSDGNAERVNVSLPELDTEGRLNSPGDMIVIDLSSEVVKTGGNAELLFENNGTTEEESASSPNPPCGDISESEQEFNDEQESQDNNVYSYTYTYVYEYEYGDYEYTYTYVYEWQGDPSPNPSPSPSPPGASGYCVSSSNLDPDPDPNPDPDPDPGNVYQGGTNQTYAGGATTVNTTDVDEFSIVGVGENGDDETVVVNEEYER